MKVFDLIGDAVFNALYFIQTCVRIVKIAKAFNIRFTKQQIRFLLNYKSHLDLSAWPRASGKTTCAIAWDLIYIRRPNPFKKEQKSTTLTFENFFVPDPDIFRHGIRNYKDLYIQYMQSYFRCAAHGLALTPVNFEHGYKLHRYFTGRKGASRHD